MFIRRVFRPHAGGHREEPPLFQNSTPRAGCEIGGALTELTGTARTIRKRCENRSFSSPARAARIGHALVARFAERDAAIITLDVNPLDATLAPLVAREFTGSITDTSLLDRMLAEFEVDCVFHLAALLSTRAEFTPITAHHVNVEGTLNLLEFAQQQGESHGRPVVFVYPSSIADLRPAGSSRPRRGPAACARTSTRIRRRCTAATSCTASSWAATTRGTTSSSRPTCTPRVDFRARPVSRA